MCVVSSVGIGKREGCKTYCKHRLLCCKFGYLCHELVTLLWREDAVDPGLSLIENTTDRALEGTSHAADSFCHFGN